MNSEESKPQERFLSQGDGEGIDDYVSVPRRDLRAAIELLDALWESGIDNRNQEVRNMANRLLRWAPAKLPTPQRPVVGDVPPAPINPGPNPLWRVNRYVGDGVHQIVSVFADRADADDLAFSEPGGSLTPIFRDEAAQWIRDLLARPSAVGVGGEADTRDYWNSGPEYRRGFDDALAGFGESSPAPRDWLADVREVLADAYTPEGVETWLDAPLSGKPNPKKYAARELIALGYGEDVLTSAEFRVGRTVAEIRGDAR